MTLAKVENLSNIKPESHRIDWVAPDALPIVWPHILPFLEKSLDKFTTSEMVYSAVSQGVAKLWVFHKDWIDGFAVTSINGDTGLIEKAGGRNLKSWFSDAIKKIEEDFKSAGCTTYQVASRKGWIKLIQPDEIDYLLTKVLR